MFAPDGNAFTASETGRRVPLFFLFRSDVPARSVRGQLESPAASASVAGRNTLSHMNYVVFRYRTGRSLTWSPRRTDSLLDALFVLEQVCTNVRNLQPLSVPVSPALILVPGSAAWISDDMRVLVRAEIVIGRKSETLL